MPLPTPADSIDVRLAVLERIVKAVEETTDLKIGRIVADIESEKGTRARLHDEWRKEIHGVTSRLAAMERHVWIGVGIVSVLQFIAPIIGRLLKLP